MARLLANGEQYFADNNGDPLGLGKVYFYIPNTTDFKDTWQDADEIILNENPVTLDAAGRAIIYGRGEYRQLVTDALGNEIWDQLTSTFDSQGSGVLWGDVSGGTPNFQFVTIAAGSPDSLVGQIICFLAGFTNTAALLFGVDAFDPLYIVKDTDAGPTQLTGGEIVAGNLVCVMFDEDAQVYHVIDYAPNDLVLQTLKVNRLSFGNSITTPALVADTNDWDPTGLSTTSRIRTSSSAVIRITGIAAQLPNRFLLFDNIGGFSIVLSKEDSASAVGNRFQTAEDIVVAAGNSVILVYDNAGAGWKVYALSATKSVLPFKGLFIRNAGSPLDSMQITAARLFVVNDTGQAIQLENINVTADISTSGANGLDTGTVAANTGYYLWVIYNSTTLTAAALWSLSSTAPTLPANYTYMSRVGWNVTNVSSELAQIIQKGSSARYVVDATNPFPVLITGGAGNFAIPTFVAVSTIGTLPPTAPIIVVMLKSGDEDSTGVAPNPNYGGVLSLDSPMAITADFTNMSIDIILESTDLFYVSDGANSSLTVIGWVDDIGA